MEEIAKDKNVASVPRAYKSPEPSESNMSSLNLSLNRNEQELPPAKYISSDPSIMNMEGIDLDISTSREQEVDHVLSDPNIMNMNDISLSMNGAAQEVDLPQKAVSTDPSIMNMDAIDISLNRTESMEREIDNLRMSEISSQLSSIAPLNGLIRHTPTPRSKGIYIYIYIYP